MNAEQTTGDRINALWARIHELQREKDGDRDELYTLVCAVQRLQSDRIDEILREHKAGK